MDSTASSTWGPQGLKTVARGPAIQAAGFNVAQDPSFAAFLKEMANRRIWAMGQRQPTSLPIGGQGPMVRPVNSMPEHRMSIAESEAQQATLDADREEALRRADIAGAAIGGPPRHVVTIGTQSFDTDDPAAMNADQRQLYAPTYKPTW